MKISNPCNSSSWCRFPHCLVSVTVRSPAVASFDHLPPLPHRKRSANIFSACAHDLSPPWRRVPSLSWHCDHSSRPLFLRITYFVVVLGPAVPRSGGTRPDTVSAMTLGTRQPSILRGPTRGLAHRSTERVFISRRTPAL
ncbi:hypothetical protein M8818_003003 [Zalaria obscura]|uniref:Uncharacterized protein n=1 Tax=Zalaria obscura TaxID=2024903 RepID=A0ACC3SG89_9PEZI